MLARVLLLLLMLIAIPDAYIYTMYVRRWTACWWKRGLYFLPSVALIAYLMAVLAHDDFRAVHQPMVGTMMIVFLAVTVPKMLFTIFDGAGVGLSRLTSDRHTFKRYARLLAMAFAIFGEFIIIYGYFWGRNKYEVHEQTIVYDNLPKKFDGYRILHFSDLHIGTFNDGHREDVRTIVDLINRQKCDMVLFTGDIVNYEAAELEGFEEVLKGIKAKDGVYSVLGNHDYDIYLPFESEAEKQKDIEKIKTVQRNCGWRLLLNENVVIRREGDSIAIIGSENDGLPPWPALGDLKKATEGLEGIVKAGENADKGNGADQSHTFSILLTHDPTHWRRNVLPETNIDLTLAGHTHAGQFVLLGWSPISHKYSEWSGIYMEGKQLINVNDGIGQILFPFRFGAWPELDIITLKTTP